MTHAVAEAKVTGIDGPTVSRKNTPEYITGRRAFFKYRELGVTRASDGKFRAQITSTEKGLSEPTGWHYHVCEGQFVFMLKGWVDLVFENGNEVRLGEGDSIYIPGGLRHNETATSETFELLEMSVPADMGTESCDPPEDMAE
ncbi:MAG TPA: cupin domain-containing protein [Gammaproteobacteria bacterium]|nr:cupin [Gammaproteobacteria bacterium]HIM98631.1 cupin domain-containing protein [Gammaproteobacteria bacterium]